MMELTNETEPTQNGKSAMTENNEISIADLLENRQREKEQGNWVPASGGTETPFNTRSGRRLLYCWQPSTGKHAYLDCQSDLLLTNEEAHLALGV